MGVFCHSNGFYYLKKMVAGKIFQFSLGVQDIRTARELYDIWLKDHFLQLRALKEKRQIQKEETKSTVTVAKKSKDDYTPLFKQYISTKELDNLSKSTMAIKDKVFHDLKKLGFLSMKDFNQEKMNELFSYYKNEKKYSADSLRKYLTEIKCFLNYCIKTGHFKSEQSNRLIFPKIPKTKIRDVVITDEELNSIFTYTKEHDLDSYVYFSTLYYLSCRPGEVLEIKKENFDFKNNICKIWMNKTKKFKTVIITDGEYLNFIQLYLQTISDNGYICKHWEYKEHYSKKFRKIKESLGIRKEIVPYSFRHSSGTHLYQSTKDIKFVANQLGDNIDTAMKVYVNTKPDDFKQYSNCLAV